MKFHKTSKKRCWLYVSTLVLISINNFDVAVVYHCDLFPRIFVVKANLHAPNNVAYTYVDCIAL